MFLLQLDDHLAYGVPSCTLLKALWSNARNGKTVFPQDCWSLYVLGCDFEGLFGMKSLGHNLNTKKVGTRVVKKFDKFFSKISKISKNP
jgi:hypothetical protein